MYTQPEVGAEVADRQARNSRKYAAGLAIVALGLCAVVFAIAEDSTTGSVRNLLLETKAKVERPEIVRPSSQQLALLGRLGHLTPKQQMLYDQGMEDEAHKQMNIAEQTFMKAKDDGVLSEYDAMNATLTEEQDALTDYADEMGAIQLEVENEAKEHAAQYSPILPSQ
jgi:hypothetical protein